MNRIGEEIVNKYGSKCKIIEYNSHDDILVKFEDGYIERGRYDAFKRGGILNWNDKFVLGIGYKGKGEYKLKENGKDTFLYIEWHSMLSRCYNKNQHRINKNVAYKDCEVDEEWHNFQNFAKWWENNFYQIEGEGMRLDKDILIKDNKIYSPSCCIIVPERINSLFCYRKSTKGDYPVGISKRKDNGRFRVRCSVRHENGKYDNKELGTYSDPIEAFNVYKNFKEKYIKQVADEYKDKIPKKLYDAMYKYEVEITD